MLLSWFTCCCNRFCSLFFCFSVVCYKQLVSDSLAHFPRFCRQYFSLCTAFSIHLARKTYFLLCSGFGILFTFYCCFAYKTKSRRRLLKTMAIFLNFVVKKALICMIGSWWFLLCFQPAETICNFHSCYRRTALFSQPIRVE